MPAKKKMTLADITYKNSEEGTWYGDAVKVPGVKGGSAKYEFLKQGKAFLKAVNKHLGFPAAKVTTNPGGPAVPGDVHTTIALADQSVLYISLHYDESGAHSKGCTLMARRGLKNYATDGGNQWLTDGTYDPEDVASWLRGRLGHEIFDLRNEQ